MVHAYALGLALAGGLLAGLVGTRLGRGARRATRRGDLAMLLLPQTLVALWRAVYGEGRGPIGDQLVDEAPTLASVPTLRWRMLFAGHRGRDLNWLRRRQLTAALAAWGFGLAVVLGLDLPLTLALPLIPVALVVGVVAIHLELRGAIADRQREMRAKAVPWLYGVAAFLSTRMSLIEALRAMAVGDSSDLAYETRLTLAKMGAGTPVDRALAVFGARCNTPEIEMAITRMRMQQRTGQGSLEDALRDVAASLRASIVAERTAYRKKAVVRTYVETTPVAICVLIVAIAAPSVYATLHLLH